jgi:hypothetical protein
MLLSKINFHWWAQEVLRKSNIKDLFRIISSFFSDQIKGDKKGRSFILHGRINLLRPSVPYTGRTAPLTSRHCILYIYSTNIGTELFKHAAHSPFSSLQNAFCFIMLLFLVPVLFTFYTQGVLKLKKNKEASVYYCSNFDVELHCMR